LPSPAPQNTQILREDGKGDGIEIEGFMVRDVKLKGIWIPEGGFKSIDVRQ